MLIILHNKVQVDSNLAEVNGQDDQIWHKAVKSEGRRWPPSYHIKSSEHKNSQARVPSSWSTL